MSSFGMASGSPNIFGCILAGGSGSRLAPYSTPEMPKQFLPIVSNRPMIRDTFARVSDMIPAHRMFVATNQKHFSAARSLLPEVPKTNLFGDPAGANKDTGPVFTTLVKRLNALDPNSIVVVLSADHWIGDVDSFQDDVRQAIMAVRRSDTIVMMGVNPDRIEPGYGYIEMGDRIPGLATRFANGFIQKPPADIAERLVESGRYVWNSGMYVFRSGLMAQLLAGHAPELWSAVSTYLALTSHPSVDSYGSQYYIEAVPKVSIDHAVMETAAEEGHLSVHPLSTPWSDVGLWHSIYSLFVGGQISDLPEPVMDELRDRFGAMQPLEGLSLQ